jgi:hypothetical protein
VHGPPIVHASPHFVVPGADGCLVLANCDLDSTYEGPQGIFYLSDLLSFGEAKGTLPTLVKNIMRNTIN